MEDWNLVSDWPRIPSWRRLRRLCGANPDLLIGLRNTDADLGYSKAARFIDQTTVIYDMANALEKAGHQTVRFTVHEDLGHNAWARVYAGEIYISGFSPQTQPSGG